MIDAYKRTLKKSPTVVTNIFLLRNDEVLLGHKKRGFGKGKYVGIGGKVEEKETIEEAALREFFEETKVKSELGSLKKAAVITYYFPHIADESWNLKMHVFTANNATENPVETDEIKPVWFIKNNLPFDQMWDDAKFWIPRVFSGDYVEEEFLYNDSLKVIDHLIYC